MLKKDVEKAKAMDREKIKIVSEINDRIKNKRDKLELAANEIWNKLKHGESLSAFGLPNIVVDKKFKQSLRDTLGQKWTKKEVLSQLC
jgi:hypothetical protein